MDTRQQTDSEEDLFVSETREIYCCITWIASPQNKESRFLPSVSFSFLSPVLSCVYPLWSELNPFVSSYYHRIMESDGNFDQDFGTRAIHAGQSPTQWPHGAVIPPICVSTTFYQPAPAEPLLGYDYSRAGNPTRTCLETCLASLEKAKYG